ncbi:MULTISPECIES: TetR/AcrR family transcriptional regulator C-terminal domain-containing protein [unclassified Nocardia]|uniref:TetR/AcrR family transcriptional regulator C-terminal domain-containing protein n=1 Tax=unclassified Nocardia TaxID=2637762 RepID=UPI00278C5F9E|nr:MULTISPECIES: TetR/AcrR family transcriptional regulator C-terminal domain-containing protein [unclassified Nocardia]
MPKAHNARTERRPPLNRARVLDAGIALADTEGVDALTMRRLGGTLGVEAMALYNHVDNKEDLFDGMLDRVAEEITLPDAGLPWRDYARARAVSAHTALMRHRWAAAMWTARISLGPARMRYMDGALRSLREAGFPAGLLDLTYHAIENHIVGHALQAQGFPLEAAEMTAMGEGFLRTFPTDRYPDLAAHIRHHLDHPTGDDFEFGLDLILDGLERMRAAI